MKGIQLLEFELEEGITADCLWKHRWPKGKQPLEPACQEKHWQDTVALREHFPPV